MDMKAYDTAEELSKLVEKHSKLKYPAGGSYAWEAGCLVAILKTIAGSHPEVLKTLEREVEWHKKQVSILEALDDKSNGQTLP